MGQLKSLIGSGTNQNRRSLPSNFSLWVFRGKDGSRIANTLTTINPSL